MSDKEKDPCEDAIDLLWQEIILKNRPDYGDWEYPGQAYRHIKDEHGDVVNQRDALRTRVAELEAKLAALAEVTAELADDLEAEVKAHYVHDGKIHPAVESKYWRDMRPVQAARALLAKEMTQ